VGGALAAAAVAVGATVRLLEEDADAEAAESTERPAAWFAGRGAPAAVAGAEVDDPAGCAEADTYIGGLPLLAETDAPVELEDAAPSGWVPASSGPLRPAAALPFCLGQLSLQASFAVKDSFCFFFGCV